MSEQLDAIQEMSEAVLNEDWEKFKTFLTDDIMYKVGSSEPTYGKQSVVDFLSSVFKTTGKLTGHDVRKVWNEPDIITIEMDANYRRLKDDEMVKVACCDVYRMRGNQVSEWRVYADATPLY